MNTLTGHTTITRQAIDGKEFSFTAVKCVEDKRWYILEDECGIDRTKQATIKTINDIIENMIEDYEYDNNLR